MTRQLLEGNEAIAEAAIRAGLQAYFGYPITPQTQLLEWMSQRMPELGRAFVQAESELGAINMVYGAACTGARVMTSSSGPGISLKMEGLSYIAGTEVPMVLVNVMRGGPGLGNIAPSQSDYNQAVHGGGHGDYYPIVLVPSSVQESIDMTVLAFDLAEKYRSIAMVLLDGSIGQMMEPAELPPMREVKMAQTDWAVSGAMGRERRFLSSIHLDPTIQEQSNLRMMRKWQEVKKAEVRYREYFMDDADFAIVAFGSAGRVCFSAVRMARAAGLKVGLIRPVTVNPFPEAVIEEISRQVDGMLVVEMNGGQMLNDVLLASRNRVPVNFYGRPGGMVPFPDEVMAEIEYYMKHPVAPGSDPRIPWLERMGSLN